MSESLSLPKVQVICFTPLRVDFSKSDLPRHEAKLSISAVCMECIPTPYHHHERDVHTTRNRTATHVCVLTRIDCAAARERNVERRRRRHSATASVYSDCRLWAIWSEKRIAFMYEKQEITWQKRESSARVQREPFAAIKRERAEQRQREAEVNAKHSNAHRSEQQYQLLNRSNH